MPPTADAGWWLPDRSAGTDVAGAAASAPHLDVTRYPSSAWQALAMSPS